METTSGSAICWPGSNVDFFFASAVTVRMTGRYEINAPEGSFGHERKYLLTVEKKKILYFTATWIMAKVRKFIKDTLLIISSQLVWTFLLWIQH